MLGSSAPSHNCTSLRSDIQKPQTQSRQAPASTPPAHNPLMPGSEPARIPIVALGAAAGGVVALWALLSGLPPKLGAAKRRLHVLRELVLNVADAPATPGK